MLYLDLLHVRAYGYPMKPKTSAHYQREYRQRLRDEGLVKKEVWIRPEHAKLLANLEMQLRAPNAPTTFTGVTVMANQPEFWTTTSLQLALLSTELFKSGQATLELIEGVEPSLLIVMKEYGDMPIFLTVSGEQIVVEAVMWPVDDVADQAAFNEAILRTHKYFPLSTISLDRIDGEGDYYHMFGALSSTSILPNILLEIEMLASNVIQATEAYTEFLVAPAAANL